MENVEEKMNNDEFLQSEHWRNFQEAVGRKTFCISGVDFNASIIEHKLPIVGKYFYIPRGPIMCHPERSEGSRDSSLTLGMTEAINSAKKNNAGWIRIEPINSHLMDLIRKNWRVVRAPHDMQSKELFVMNITKSEEELLAEMKSKTRYNIKLAQKKGVSVTAIINNQDTNSRKRCHPERSEGSRTEISNNNSKRFFADTQNDSIKKYLEEFIRLTKITAKRDGITPHPDDYYRKMFEAIPNDIIKLYVAEYEGKVIAANIMLFCGKIATYMHGASDNDHRNVMAPFLLQWKAIQDAKHAGCERYDFGGVRTVNAEQLAVNNKWAGITRFKIGFSPETKPTEFCGSWDIVIKPFRYQLYKILSKIRGMA